MTYGEEKCWKDEDYYQDGNAYDVMHEIYCITTMVGMHVAATLLKKSRVNVFLKMYFLGTVVELLLYKYTPCHFNSCDRSRIERMK